MEVVHGAVAKVANQAISYTRGHQGPQYGQVDMVKRPPMN